MRVVGQDSLNFCLKKHLDHRNRYIKYLYGIIWTNRSLRVWEFKAAAFFFLMKKAEVFNFVTEVKDFAKKFKFVTVIVENETTILNK
ncbi:hypothetical protein RclHR1_00040016 [Rhizophagus clarus]|uniref:Uncharacterized protein n=1 Tax=Rhizophagus clarus TaxID=94130 RepID=A0A2Z6RRL3_9GLOM|nr:hypothetical protein RclHR1_00040016 [Rhizophagus clarus]